MEHAVAPQVGPPVDRPGEHELVDGEAGQPRQQHPPPGPGVFTGVPLPAAEHEVVGRERAEQRHEHRPDQVQEVDVVVAIHDQGQRSAADAEHDRRDPPVEPGADVLQ